MCTQHKLQKQLKKEKAQTRKELGNFCQQFDPSFQVNKKVEKPKTCSGDYSRKHKPKKSHHKPRFSSKAQPSEKSEKRFSSSYKCFKCGKTGHTQRYCYLNKKIHQLKIDEETKNQVCNLLIESSDSDTKSSSTSEEGLQMDELDWSSDEKSINVLTKDQEFLLEIADQIQNPLLRKQYLEKLKQGTLEGETKTPNYNLSEILKRHDKKRAHKTSFDAKKEIEILRNEVDCLRFKQQQHSSIIGELKELFTEARKPSASSDQNS
ncbi:hypothetical protein CDL15_Pgr022970 [Punica granatum]|uniref:CCHC-type domain-containing protein n=1 Tax=Punica granatum TaxID=22663 RepID=A0A218X449_PUNGR|nr:hypothetical protein CDL15_Pgr022970 [Punica granatum]